MPFGREPTVMFGAWGRGGRFCAGIIIEKNADRTANNAHLPGFPILKLGICTTSNSFLSYDNLDRRFLCFKKGVMNVM